MSYREKFPRRIYFQIGEVANLVARTTSAVRFWLDNFNIGTLKRGKGGKRSFTQSDLEKVLAIKYLIDVEQYTMKGAEVKYNLWLKGKFDIPKVYTEVPEEYLIRQEEDYVLEHD